MSVFVYKANRQVEVERFAIGDRVVHTCYDVSGTVIATTDRGMTVRWDEPIDGKTEREYR